MTDFLGGDLLTATQRQELTIEKALELRRQQWKHEGFLYRGAGDLLLRHGRFYTGRELPPNYQHLKGESTRCFENTLLACEADSSLRYCEGIYAIGAGHYTPHAWCLDPAGELLEVTMPTEPGVLARGTEAETKLGILPLEHWGYWGAVFHPEYVRACFDAQEFSGLLDRPIHDELFATGDLAVDEPRTDWPVYRYPYDPQRRTP